MSPSCLNFMRDMPITCEIADDFISAMFNSTSSPSNISPATNSCSITSSMNKRMMPCNNSGIEKVPDGQFL